MLLDLSILQPQRTIVQPNVKQSIDGEGRTHHRDRVALPTEMACSWFSPGGGEDSNSRLLLVELPDEVMIMMMVKVDFMLKDDFVGCRSCHFLFRLNRLDCPTSDHSTNPPGVGRTEVPRRH
jgi:hypothetical protein